jgi:hypothetical protein
MYKPVPLFVHVHVPKTAGTSLNRLLERWFGERHVNHYDPRPNHCYTIPELEQFVAQRPEMLSLASHSFRLFPPFLAGRPVFYHTTLREPFDRFISNFTYAKKNFRNLSPEHRGRLPENVESMGLREFILARSGDSKAERKPGSGNPLNRFFADPWFRSRRPSLSVMLPEDETAAEAEFFSRMCLPVSMQILEGFLVVGITERFSQSVALLRKRMEQQGFLTDECHVPEENRSRELRESEPWLTSNDELVVRIKESLALDSALYEYGSRLFEEAAKPPAVRNDPA